MEWEEAVNEQSLSNIMEDLGYYLLSPSHCDSPGYTGLLVAIRKQPTGTHYDPKTLRLPLRDAKRTVDWRTLSWLSPAADSSQVCPGRAILSDRFDERIEFFTFGGLLEVTCEPGEMMYLLRSAAPILQLTAPEETIPDQMAAETESLIAEAHARWGRNDEGFSRRLAEVDPFRFYLASLHSILLRYEHVDALELTYHVFCEALNREKNWLVAEGLWPANPPMLEDLLAPE
jgi:hypothetical protein